MIFTNGKLTTISSSAVTAATENKNPEQNENTLYSIGSFNTWAQEVARNLGDTIDLDKSKDNVNNFITSSLPFAIDKTIKRSLVQGSNLDDLASQLVSLRTPAKTLFDNYEKGLPTVGGRVTTSMTIARVMLVEASMMKLTYNNNKFKHQTPLSDQPTFVYYETRLENLIDQYFDLVNGNNNTEDIVKRSGCYLSLKKCRSKLIVYNTNDATPERSTFEPSLATTSLLADSYMAAAMTMYQSICSPQPSVCSTASTASTDPINFATGYLDDFRNYDMDQKTGSKKTGSNPSGRFPPLDLNQSVGVSVDTDKVIAYSQMAPQILLLSTPNTDPDPTKRAYREVVTDAFTNLYAANPDTGEQMGSTNKSELPYRYNTSKYNDFWTKKPVKPLPPEYYPSSRGDFFHEKNKGYSYSPWMVSEQSTPYIQCIDLTGTEGRCGRYEFDPHILGRLGGLLLTSTLDSFPNNTGFYGQTLDFYVQTLDKTKFYMANVDQITSVSGPIVKDYNKYIYCNGGTQQTASKDPSPATCAFALENAKQQASETTTIPVLCNYLLAKLGLLVNDDMSTLTPKSTDVLTIRNYLDAIDNKTRGKYTQVSPGDDTEDNTMALLLAGFYMDGVFVDIGNYEQNKLVKFHNKMTYFFPEFSMAPVRSGAQTSYTGVKK